MQKSKVAGILAPYSPPLSPSQVDAIAKEIGKISTLELADTVKKLHDALMQTTPKRAKSKRKS